MTVVMSVLKIVDRFEAYNVSLLALVGDSEKPLETNGLILQHVLTIWTLNCALSGQFYLTQLIGNSSQSSVSFVIWELTKMTKTNKDPIPQSQIPPILSSIETHPGWKANWIREHWTFRESTTSFISNKYTLPLLINRDNFCTWNDTFG